MEQIIEVVMSDVKPHDRNTSDCSQDILDPVYPSKDMCLTLAYSLKDKIVSNFMDNSTSLVWIQNVARGSNETEYRIAGVLWQVCPVILFIFGTVGNIMILLMLRTLRLGRTTMHVYLRALAISDLCVLYTGLLRWWIIWSFGMDIRDQHVLVCKLHTWMVYMALYISAWLLVFMTTERTCSACVPHRVNTFCTKRRACCLVTFLVLLQSLMQSHFLFGMTLMKPDESGAQKCEAISSEYNFFLHDVYPFVDLVLLSLIPFICVILGNIIIIWKTFLSIKTAAELNLTSNKGTNLRRRRASSMTVILISLSALFLLTTSPTCVYNMWERGESAKEEMKTSTGAARIELAWASVNIIMYCNNTFNFYLYCLSGRKFRTEIWHQLSRRRTDSHSMVLSAPSIHLHKCPHNEQKYSPAKENCTQMSKARENGSRLSAGRIKDNEYPTVDKSSNESITGNDYISEFPHGNDKVKEFIKVIGNCNGFINSHENIHEYRKVNENVKGFHKTRENNSNFLEGKKGIGQIINGKENDKEHSNEFYDEDVTDFLKYLENGNELHENNASDKEYLQCIKKCKRYPKKKKNDKQISQGIENFEGFPKRMENVKGATKRLKVAKGFAIDTDKEFSKLSETDKEFSKLSETEKGFFKVLETDYDCSESLETIKDCFKSIETGKDCSRSIESEKDCSRSVKTDKDCSKSVKTDNDCSRSVKTDKDCSRSVKTDKDCSRSVKTDKDCSRSVKTDKDCSRSVKIDKDCSRSVQTDKDCSRSVKTDKDCSRSIRNKNGFHKSRENDTGFHNSIEIDSGFHNGGDSSRRYLLFESRLYAQRSVTYL